MKDFLAGLAIETDADLKTKATSLVIDLAGKVNNELGAFSLDRRDDVFDYAQAHCPGLLINDPELDKIVVAIAYNDYNEDPRRAALTMKEWAEKAKPFFYKGKFVGKTDPHEMSAEEATNRILYLIAKEWTQEAFAGVEGNIRRAFREKYEKFPEEGALSKK